MCTSHWLNDRSDVLFCRKFKCWLTEAACSRYREKNEICKLECPEKDVVREIEKSWNSSWAT
jgi:hypothetical protein